MIRPSGAALRGLALSALAGAACAGCGGDEDAFSIGVHATLDGEPLRGVEIAEGGMLIGETDDAGNIRLATARPEGTELELEVRCPEGHRARPERLRTRLRRLDPLPGRETAPVLHLDVRCERTVRDVVVVVDTGQPGLDVLVDGRVVDRTDEQGRAHLWMEQAPGQRLAMRIDTSSRPELAPPSPEQRFTIGWRDEVFYWARPLAIDEPEDEPRRGGRGRGRRGRGGGGPRELERLR